MPARRTAVVKRSGPGTGWRPPSPGGAARSSSTSRYAAPGMWPASYCWRPVGPVSASRVSTSTVPSASDSTSTSSPGRSTSGAERERFGGEGDGACPGRSQPAPVVLPAEHLVGHFGRRPVGRVDVADHDHLTLHHHHSVLRAGVVGGALAAPAQSLDLED